MRRTAKLTWPLVFVTGLIFAIGCNNQTDADDAAEDATTTAQDEPAEATSQDEVSPIAQGEELYISYCAICHGEDGKGNGSMASMLTIPPTDLTMIAARRGGEYPSEAMYEIIDGQTEVAGHGTDEMPIWGETFQESERLGSEEEVEQRINSLVAYLETIQVEAEQ